jgi:hypothetical protein
MKKTLALALTIASASVLTACGASNGHGSTVMPTTQTQSKSHHSLKDRLRQDVFGGAPRFRLALDLGILDLLSTKRGVRDASQDPVLQLGMTEIDAVLGNDYYAVVGDGTAAKISVGGKTHSALGGTDLPAGQYQMIEIVVDPAQTTVVQGGVTYPVQIVGANPVWWDVTGTLQAMDVPFAFTGASQASVQITLDFHVAASVSIANGVAIYTPQTTAAASN